MDNKPWVRKPEMAEPALHDIEANLISSVRGVYPRIPQREEVLSALDEWYMANYGFGLKALPGDEKHKRAIIRLVSHRVETLTHNHHAFLSQQSVPEDERQKTIREFELKVHAWVGVVARFTPVRNDGKINADLNNEMKDFFFANKGVLTDIYTNVFCLTDYAEVTDRSGLAPYVGTLLAAAMAQEYIEWESEQYFDEEQFPCDILTRVDDTVLQQPYAGKAFTAECRRIRGDSTGIPDFGTAQWYIEGGMAPLIASLCDRSREFNRGIDECNMSAVVSYPREENDERAFPVLGDDDHHLTTPQALQLLRTSTAAHAFTNAVYFACGNSLSRGSDEQCCIEGMTKLIAVVEKVVEDKASFGRVCEIECDRAKTRNIVERRNSRHALEEEFEIGERMIDHAIAREGESLSEVIDTLFERFPDPDNRHVALELLRDFYLPCHATMDPERHSTIATKVLGELNYARDLNI